MFNDYSGHFLAVRRGAANCELCGKFCQRSTGSEDDSEMYFVRGEVCEKCRTRMVEAFHNASNSPKLQLRMQEDIEKYEAGDLSLPEMITSWERE